MFWSSLSCLSLQKLILLIIFSHSIDCQSLVFPEHVHEKCVSKSDATDIRMSCETKQRIAIHEAFFTTSVRHRCPFSLSSFSEPIELTKEDQEDIDSYPPIPPPCTDDLRLSLNRRCSGHSNCKFNLKKDHIPVCIGEDGSVKIKYTCIAEDKFHPYCNLNLTDNYGYVSNPGYPNFYPPYVDCVWRIEGGNGQIVQIDVLDAAIREPQIIKANNRKKQSYMCTDKLVVTEENTKMLTVCGEDKSSLVQHRTKSNHLTVELKSSEFSPTRGILFRYSLHNCPTIDAPKNGHLISRNGSFAYYSCCVDYVFEDTKEVDRVLYCEFGSHWNSSVSKCIAKESLFSSSLSLTNNETNNPLIRAQTDETSIDGYISDILIPIVLMIALLLGNAVIIWVLFRLRRKRKQDVKNTESNIPLNSGSGLQTSV